MPFGKWNFVLRKKNNPHATFKGAETGVPFRKGQSAVKNYASGRLNLLPGGPPRWKSPYSVAMSFQRERKGSEQSRVLGYGDNGGNGRQLITTALFAQVYARPLSRMEGDDALFQIKPADRFAVGQGIWRASSGRGPEDCGPAFLP